MAAPYQAAPCRAGNSRHHIPCRQLTAPYSARPGGKPRTPIGVPKNRPPCRGAAGRRRRNAAGRSAGGFCRDALRRPLRHPVGDVATSAPRRRAGSLPDGIVLPIGSTTPAGLCQHDSGRAIARPALGTLQGHAPAETAPARRQVSKECAETVPAPVGTAPAEKPGLSPVPCRASKRRHHTALARRPAPQSPIAPRIPHPSPRPASRPQVLPAPGPCALLAVLPAGTCRTQSLGTSGGKGRLKSGGKGRPSPGGNGRRASGPPERQSGFALPGRLAIARRHWKDARSGVPCTPPVGGVLCPSPAFEPPPKAAAVYEVCECAAVFKFHRALGTLG